MTNELRGADRYLHASIRPTPTISRLLALAALAAAIGCSSDDEVARNDDDAGASSGGASGGTGGGGPTGGAGGVAGSSAVGGTAGGGGSSGTAGGGGAGGGGAGGTTDAGPDVTSPVPDASADGNVADAAPGEAGADADGRSMDASDGAPPNPPSGGRALWLRADVGVTTGDGGTGVSSWTDPTTSTTLPAFGSITLVADAGDGMPALSFPGGSYLQVALASGLTDATVFVRFNYANDQSTNEYLYTIGVNTLSTAGATLALSRGESNNVASRRSYHWNGAAAHYGTDISSSVWHTSSQAYVGTASDSGAGYHTLWLDGVDAAMDSVSAPYDVTGSIVVGSWIGLSNGFVGMLRELILYDRGLSTPERQAIEAYLNTR